jgi:hypothetical protein
MKSHSMTEVARMLQELDLFDDRWRISEELFGVRKGLKAMNPAELDSMAQYCYDQGYKSKEQLRDADNEQRRKIISLLRGIGFTYFCEIKQRTVADMPRIHKYVQEVGYLHKNMNAYTSAELPKLVTQIEIIHNKEIKNFNK